MAMGIIDLLEKIQIQKQDCQMRGIALHPFQLTVKRNFQIAVIEETAQVINEKHILCHGVVFSILKGMGRLFKQKADIFLSGMYIGKIQARIVERNYHPQQFSLVAHKNKICFCNLVCRLLLEKKKNTETTLDAH